MALTEQRSSRRSAWRWPLAAGATAALATAAPASAHSVTQVLDVWMGEGKIIGEDKEGNETIIGEFHRWEPSVLVVHQGDQVVLRVRNPRKHIHSFELENEWYNLDTGPLEPRKGEVVLRFTADVSGVFEFRCGIKYNPDKGECAPDHSHMTGQLIVLEPA